MEEKKKGKGTVFFIIILILIIIGLGAYICYDKGLIFGSKESKTEEKDTKKEESVNKETKTNEELDELGKYSINTILKRYFINPPEVSKSSAARLNLLSFIIVQSQSGGYEVEDKAVCIPKTDYKEKYKEVYGDNYSLDEDLKDKEAIWEWKQDKNYYCTYPVEYTGPSIEFNVTGVEKEDDKYILSGNRITYGYDANGKKELYEKEEFQITYNKKDGKRHLIDIVIE